MSCNITEQKAPRCHGLTTAFNLRIKQNRAKHISSAHNIQSHSTIFGVKYPIFKSLSFSLFFFPPKPLTRTPHTVLFAKLSSRYLKNISFALVGSSPCSVKIIK